MNAEANADEANTKQRPKKKIFKIVRILDRPKGT